MIRIGQREFEVPLWLWVAVPLAFAVYWAYGRVSYGAIDFAPDSYYLQIMRQCAAGSLAGFVLIDLARRSATPWYGLVFLLAASVAGSTLAVGWLNTLLTVAGPAIGAAGVTGAFGLAGLVSVALLGGLAGPVSVALLGGLAGLVAVVLLGGLPLALVLTFASRFLLGLPMWTKDTRREFWTNFGGALLWLVIALGSFAAIRFYYGLALGYPASVVPTWLPLAGAAVGALAATAGHLWVAHHFRRGEINSRHNLRVSLLAAFCVAMFPYNPGLFGSTGSRIGYDYIRPWLRAAHVLPTPDLSIAGYRVDIPFHDLRTLYGTAMPDGKPSYLYVPLPPEYGLTKEGFRPTVFIYRRDATSIYWAGRRTALEGMQARQPGKDAVIRSPDPRLGIAMRMDEYPEADFQLTGLDPATSTEAAEQVLRRFLREQVRRTN